MPEFFLTLNGPMDTYPPLSNAALATFAAQIAGGLNLPPPYSAASLVTWFQSATLGNSSGGQQTLQVVVGYAIKPEAGLLLESIPLQAIASAPATLVGIADGLFSAPGFITVPGSKLVIASSDASGKLLGAPVPIAGV